MRTTTGITLMITLCALVGCTTQPENHPPEKASALYPADGATGIFIQTTLYWTASDPDGDPLTYDVYIGTTTSPVLAQSDWPATEMNIAGLGHDMTYYWKIDTKDGQGNVTEGDQWQFETIDSTSNYQQYYLATGTYTEINGNYNDPDPERGAPWIALSSHGSYGADAQWEFTGFTKAETETLTIGAYSFDNGWDITGGEHYHLYNHETQEWDFLFDSNKQEDWHYAQLTGTSAKPYVNDTSSVVILQLESGYTDHSHIREVFCRQADVDTGFAGEDSPGTITINGGMEQPELRN